MYLPTYSAEANPVAALQTIVQKSPLGILCTNGARGLDANHLPFELEEAAVPSLLTTHVARANSVWQDVANGDEVLVIFRGADGYISPNWYPSKREGHEHVPTWNYQVVHVHGRIFIRDDPKFVRAVVGRLSRRHEADQPHPWTMSQMAQASLTGLLEAIVGLEVGIDRVDAKSKLGQNRERQDIEGAAAGLRSRGHDALAEAMLIHAPAKVDNR